MGTSLSERIAAGQQPQQQPAQQQPTTITGRIETGLAQQPTRLEMALRQADDLVRSVASGATSLFADELAAAANTALGIGPGKTFEENLAAERARDEAINPALRTAGEIGGGIATTVATGGLGLLSRLPAVAAVPATGAVEGALAGAGGAEGGLAERATGAGIGAGLGLGIGLLGAGAGAGIQRLARSGSPARQAELQIMRALESDAIDPARVAARARQLGPEATLADVGGPNVRGLARGAVTRPGPARQMAEQALERRSLNQGRRINQTIDDVVSGRNFARTTDEIIETRRAAATPLYERAFREQPEAGLTGESIDRLLANPTVRSAISRARRINLDLQDLPDNSLEVLDQAYKFIGGRANAVSRTGDNVTARSLNNLRENLRGAIVERVPAYGEALNAFSDQSLLLDALQAGRNFAREEAELTAKTISRMSNSEKEFFVAGVAQSLRDIVNNTRDGVNVARRLLGTQTARNRLRAALPDNVTFRQFQRQVLREQVFAETTAAVMRGSRTAPMLSEAANISAPLGIVRTLNVFGPMAAAREVGARALQGIAGQLDSSDAVTREVGRAVFSPVEIDPLVQELVRQRGLRQLATTGAGALTGGVATTAPQQVR